MLEQEGLAEISQSSASEQVAYLLVERVTLLERLEAAERKLDTQTLTGNLREVHLQVLREIQLYISNSFHKGVGQQVDRYNVYILLRIQKMLAVKSTYCFL